MRYLLFICVAILLAFAAAAPSKHQNSKKIASTTAKPHQVSKSNSETTKKPVVIQKHVNFIEVPKLCGSGQSIDRHGNCRDGVEYRRKRNISPNQEPIEIPPSIDETDKINHPDPKKIEPICIIGCQVPTLCPVGEKFDHNGICRPVFDDY